MSKELTDAIVGMHEDEAMALVASMLDGGTDPTEVLEEAKDAMTELGRRFECEEVFIPELIMGGEIMKNIAEELKPHMKGEAATPGARHRRHRHRRRATSTTSARTSS